MDKSETNIKMCEKAEEIQKHQIVDGDCYYWVLASGEGQVCLSFTETFPDYKVHHPEQWDYLHGRKIIWLPHQDQLQEMVIVPPGEYPDGTEGSIEHQRLSFLACSLYGMFIDSYYPEQYLDRFTSMEQLWLAFVMKEKYNKTWDGENWIK